MSVALGSTWNPRGELSRLKAALPTLLDAYARVCLVLPPTANQEVADGLGFLDKLSVRISAEWSWGRHLAVQEALQCSADFIQYADLDRLLRWVETHPDEWRATLALIRQVDCLVIGRSENAYRTHPQALVQTERLTNQVFSLLLGQELDLSAGSKGFSRRAAEFLITHSPPGRALGTDAEWPVLLFKAGFRVAGTWVDGLDWESADRYRPEAADLQTQRAVAREYDSDPRNWAWRVAVAAEIIQAGLEAWGRIIE